MSLINLTGEASTNLHCSG